MKKLYIPTSTLNFNNIFASESISPACFYSKRNFGYKTFEKVKLDKFDNTILLYDKLPVFEIIDTERDNYPMIIEVDNIMKNHQPINTHDDVSIFQYADTVYINPFSTKVYFLTEEAKKITLLGTERSLSTKMWRIYEKYGVFLLKDDSIPSFQFNDEYLTDIKEISSENLSKAINIDQRKNRVKGFMYSFLFGANKSLNKELVTIKKCTKEIRNIISAVLHSPDKRMTSQQKESLDKIGNEFSDAYNSLDNDTEILNKKLKEIVGKANNTIDSAKELVKSLGYSWEQAENYVCGQYKICKPLNVKTLLQPDFENTVSKINEIVVQKETEYLRSKQKLNISERIALANFKLTSLSEEKADFYTTLINEFISIDYQKESRINIAVRGINLLKEMFKEQNFDWDKSPDRTYYNELLLDLQGKGSFEVRKTDNIIQQSFALFVLYKDDIEKIETALISNLISEYRFAFGLWGAVVGFAGMPKTLTNDLFLSDDLDYISKVYKYIFKQVHGIELEEKLETKKQEEYPKQNETISEDSKDLITKAINSVRNENKFNEYSTILENAKNDAKSIPDFMKRITNNSKINKNTKLYKKIKEFLFKQPQQQSKKVERTISFPSDENTQNAVKNNSLLFENSSFTQEQKQKLDENLIYIKTKHKMEEDRDKAIEHFINLCKDKNGKFPKYKVPYFNLIEKKIKNILESKFPD